jgi:hypothetical protein
MYGKDTYEITQNRTEQPDIVRHKEEKKEVARN